MRARISEELTGRIPIIGKIKIGQKSQSSSGKEIPQSLDYFVAAGNYAHYFNEAFGDKPNSIEIMFLSNDLSEACRERFELRKGAKLYAYGDGTDFKVYDHDKDEYVDMSMTTHSDAIKGLSKKVEGKWETVLTISFLIPRIRGVFGAWTLTTKGVKSSIPGIKSSFDVVQNMAGTVIGIPFDLAVEKVVSNKPESKSKYPVLRLVANVSSGHLEKVKSFLAGKNAFMGMLTEDKIDDLAMGEVSKQIENKVATDEK